MFQGEKIRLRTLDVNDLDFVHACKNNSGNIDRNWIKFAIVGLKIDSIGKKERLQ